jgi:hypothetical protein
MSAPVPYYLITSCCSQEVMSGLYRIPGLGTVPNGVYQYTGPTFTESVTGMVFDDNFCYTVIFQGTTSTLYPSAFNSSTIILTASNDCDDPICAPCGPKFPAYSIFNCCDTANVISLNIDTDTCLPIDGVWVYNGPGYIEPISGFIFTPGECYNFTELPDGIFEQGPDCTDFDITIYDTCQEAQADAECPACALALEFLIFTSCCDDTQILFKGPFPTSTYYGVREYLGLPINGLENVCYSIETGVVGDPLVPDITAYNLLPDPPVYVEGLTFSSLSSINTDCALYIDECPSCIKQCYTLYDCDGNSFNTQIDLSAYLNTFITIIQLGVPSGPWYVIENNTGKCNNAVTGFTVSPTVPAPCDCNCYIVIASAQNCIYVDCDGNLQSTGFLSANNAVQFCSLIYPSIIGNAQLPTGGPSPIYIQNEGLCIDGECPIICYVLEDCAGIQDPIYATKPSLSPYAILGQIVVLDNYPGTCWEVIDTAECDCAIDVTVIQSYDSCIICQNAPKYKLTNCDDKTLIVYTSTDLSAYVGQVIIRLDCPGCWYVEEIEDIPSDVPITVDVAYIDCIECARDYYLLTDCTGYKDPIITYTDLSQYVGSVIKIKYCPETCWSVATTLLATNAGIVIPEVEYEDCPECLLTFPCICTTVRNDSTTSKDYRYYDCNLDIQFFTLAPGEKSERFCIRVWAIYFPETDYIETYGDCSETTSDIWECPAIIYPRRSVQPGYNTPACTIVKYEKISCKSAEVYYKQVLYLRYGISDCCPDENDKWLIKKELIDMDALRDPNYECTVVNSCCPSTPSCGQSSCGCTSSIPCNSH